MNTKTAIMPGLARISVQLTKLERMAEILTQDSGTARPRLAISAGLRNVRAEIHAAMQEILQSAKSA